MKMKNKSVSEVRAMGEACEVLAAVLSLIEILSREGWCVGLKKTPPDVGYLEAGTGKRKFPGHWFCEVAYIRSDMTVDKPECGICEDPLLLMREMARRCRQATDK